MAASKLKSKLQNIKIRTKAHFKVPEYKELDIFTENTKLQINFSKTMFDRSVSARIQK